MSPRRSGGPAALPCLLLALIAACTSALGATDEPITPREKITLFNGKDLSGWRGGSNYDHRKLLSMPEAERAALIAKWTASLTQLKDGKPHWRAEDGVLFNDGQGEYATTERDYGFD